MGHRERVVWISLVCVLSSLVLLLGISYWRASDDATLWARTAMDRAFFWTDNQTWYEAPVLESGQPFEIGSSTILPP